MVERVLGDGRVVWVLDGARLSMARARESAREGESEQVNAK